MKWITGSGKKIKEPISYCMRWVVKENQPKFMGKRVKGVVYQGSSAVVDGAPNTSTTLGSIASKPYSKLVEKKGTDTLAKATLSVRLKNKTMS